MARHEEKANTMKKVETRGDRDQWMLNAPNRGGSQTNPIFGLGPERILCLSHGPWTEKSLVDSREVSRCGSDLCKTRT